MKKIFKQLFCKHEWEMIEDTCHLYDGGCSKGAMFKCPKCGKFLIEKNDKVHGNYKVCVDEKDCGYKLLEEYSNE